MYRLSMQMNDRCAPRALLDGVVGLMDPVIVLLDMLREDFKSPMLKLSAEKG